MVKHTHVTIMMDNLRLFSPEQPFMERKVVSTSEKGRKYVLALNPPHGCAVYQIDNFILSRVENAATSWYLLNMMPSTTNGRRFSWS